MIKKLGMLAGYHKAEADYWNMVQGQSWGKTGSRKKVYIERRDMHLDFAKTLVAVIKKLKKG